MSEAVPGGSGKRRGEERRGGERPPRARPLLRTLIGDVLRRQRLEQRRTLADVARHARVSVPYLSEVERGRKEASSEVLSAVCDALRMELSDLLAEVGRDLVKDGAPVLSIAAALRRRDALERTRHGHPAANGHDLDTVRVRSVPLSGRPVPRVAGPRRRPAGPVLLAA